MKFPGANVLNRRGFLGSILASCCAPAFVKAGILMPVKEIILLNTGLILPLITPGAGDCYVCKTTATWVAGKIVHEYSWWKNDKFLGKGPSFPLTQ